MNKTNTVGLTNLARTYYSPKILEVLRSSLVYENLLSKESDDVIAEEQGPVIQWTRSVDVGQATTIDEGGSAPTTTFSTETVTATLIQKAKTFTLSDRVTAFTLIRALTNKMNTVGRSAAITIDGMIRRKLTHGGFRETIKDIDQDDLTVMSNVSHSAITGGTTEFATTYTNGGVTYTHLPWMCLSGSNDRPTNILPTSINSSTPETVPANFTTSAMKATVTKLKFAVKKLKKANVEPFSDSFYHAVMSYEAAFDIENDPDLLSYINYAGDANRGNGPINYRNGELGTVADIKIFTTTEAENAMYVHSNGSYFSTDVAASAWTPDVITITGKGCCAMVDHTSMDVGDSGLKALHNIKINIVGFKPDKTDPNGTYMLISYKLMTAVGILNTECGINLLQFHSATGHA